MRRRRKAGRSRGGPLAVVLGLAGTVGLGLALAGPALIGIAATAALRDAGFSGARVAVADLGLTDDWRALRLGMSADLGDLRPVGLRSGTGLTGRAAVSGALAIRPGLQGIAVSPLTCLSGAAEALSVAAEPIAIPQGLRLCGSGDAPAVVWRPGSLAVAVRAEVPRLDLPGRMIRGDDLTATVIGTDGQTTVDLLIRSLSHTGKPADIVPLTVTARMEQPAGGVIRLTGGAEGARGLLSVSVSGGFDPATGKGTLDLRTKPVRLPADGPGLAALSPRLGALVTDVAGTATIRATLSHDGKGLTSNAQVLLQKVAGRIGPVSVAGVNGTVRLTSLSPPVIPDGQLLSVGLLDVGLPLTEGTLRFGYGRDGRLDVDAAEWRWAGGTLRADPFELNPTAPDGTVTLHASSVDLGRLLTLVEVDGLDAAGALSGTLPVRFAADTVRLDGGVLEAAGPGTLRYDPANPPAALKGAEGSAGAMLLGALTDFRYDSLRLTVDGQAGGELAVGFAIRGANPTFYNGYPVSLNLKVSGALDRILRQSLDAARIPDTVRDRMTEFERKDP